MKHPAIPMAAACLALASMAMSAPMGHQAVVSPVHELRVYTAHPGKRETLLARFREHTCAFFERHGMKNVGYWVPLDGGDKLYYLLEHKNRAAAAASWNGFRADPEWQAVRAASEVEGEIVAGVESVFLGSTDYSGPITIGPGAPGRVFELRTYSTLPDRLSKLDARFREHTRKLFARHGMTNLGYFHPLDADKGAGDTLIYFLAHDSRQAAEASWAAFQSDPDWIAAREASEADGKILQPQGVTSDFLVPTDFSALK